MSLVKLRRLHAWSTNSHASPLELLAKAFVLLALVLVAVAAIGHRGVVAAACSSSTRNNVKDSSVEKHVLAKFDMWKVQGNLACRLLSSNKAWVRWQVYMLQSQQHHGRVCLSKWCKALLAECKRDACLP